jgi:hypothetical protein
MQLDIQLPLWRDCAEAAAASVTLNSNDSEPVSCIFPDTLVSNEQTFFDHFLVFVGLLDQFFFFQFGFSYDVGQFIPFDIDVIVPFSQDPLSFFDLFFTKGKLSIEFTDAFFR